MMRKQLFWRTLRLILDAEAWQLRHFQAFLVWGWHARGLARIGRRKVNTQVALISRAAEQHFSSQAIIPHLKPIMICPCPQGRAPQHVPPHTTTSWTPSSWLLPEKKVELASPAHPHFVTFRIMGWADSAQSSCNHWPLHAVQLALAWMTQTPNGLKDAWLPTTLWKSRLLHASRDWLSHPSPAKPSQVQHDDLMLHWHSWLGLARVARGLERQKGILQWLQASASLHPPSP